MTITVITGAARGIGFELCTQLKARGDNVVAVCRKPTPALEKLGVRIEAGVDVADADAVADLPKRLAGEQVGLLINNAGILNREGLDALDFASIEKQFEVNALGPLRVTASLRPLLAPGAKVVIITSRMGSMGDNGSGGYYGYRMSKAAVNAAGVSLARDLKPQGVAVALIHPGMVNTEMTGHGIEPRESVEGILKRINELDMENAGRFLHATTGEQLPW
jgi:NAD(P)-dependent dehydrogenase (short-subunit alcohol dehydrogenase family)